MRILAPLLIALTCAPALGQQQPQPAAYLLTKTNLTTQVIASYEKVGMFYRIVDRAGHPSQLFESSVKSIEPLTAAQLAALDRPQGVTAPMYPAASTIPSAPPPGTPTASPPTSASMATTTATGATPTATPSPDPIYGSGISYPPSARLRTRSTARTTPRINLPAPRYDPPPVTDFGSPGTTATGIPLHVGPRGGVYHYSASGRKVYQS